MSRRGSTSVGSVDNQVSHDVSVNLKQLNIKIAEMSGMGGRVVRWYT